MYLRDFKRIRVYEYDIRSVIIKEIEYIFIVYVRVRAYRIQ